MRAGEGSVGGGRGQGRRGTTIVPRGGKAAFVVAFAALGACEPEAPPTTGGVELEETFGPNGEECGRGLAVVNTDYASTSLALVDLAGRTLSGSIVSSASVRPQLNAPLGGDVVLPSGWSRGGELVLLDRYPTSVLTFLELSTGEVRGQLDVGQGFAANPQDYLELDAGRALVTRYDQNPDVDAPLERRGDDVLVVDPRDLEIRGVVDLSELRGDAGFLVRPGRMLRLGDFVLVTSTGYDARFVDAAAARIFVLDARELRIVRSVTLEGMKNCGGLSLSPSGAELAVVCSGLVRGADAAAPGDSGLVWLSTEPDEGGAPRLEELERLEAASLGFGPFLPHVAYVSDELLLAGASGAQEGADAGRPDRVFAVRRADAAAPEVLLESSRVPFSLGEIVCATGCGVCFVADATRGLVHRFELDAQALKERGSFAVESDIGLPPRLLGHL